MDRQTIDYLHKLMLDYGDWLKGGRSFIGLYPPTWPETTNKKPVKASAGRRRGVKKEKQYLPLPQPHETRRTPHSRPLTARINPVYDRIDSVIIHQPQELREAVAVLYLMQLPFSQAKFVLNVSSKALGKRKARILKAVDTVV